MKHPSRIVIAATILSLAVLLWCPCKAFSAEFSADLIRSGGGDEDTSKVWVKGNLRREEVKEDGEVSAINITRPDKGVTWNLMPDEKMYMEIPLQGMDLSAIDDIGNLESRAKVRVLGQETLNGYNCEKRQYDYNDKSQGSVLVWYSSKLGYPIKIHMKSFGGEGNIILEYKNINVGPIPDSMFEIPRDYTKFAIPGMPKGMPKGIPKIPGMGD